MENTTHYSLRKPAADDRVLLADFDHNWDKLDAALKQNADAVAAETTARQSAITAEATARQSAISAETTARQSAVSSLQTAINGRGNCQVVVGTYTGDGTKTRTLTFASKPMFVYITEAAQSSKKYEFSLVYGMTVARACTSTTVDIDLTWGDTSVTLNIPPSAGSYGLNVDGVSYIYVALLEK